MSNPEYRDRDGLKGPRFELTQDEDGGWFINDRATGESYDTCERDRAAAEQALEQHQMHLADLKWGAL